jgi:hypothetical protein
MYHEIQLTAAAESGIKHNPCAAFPFRRIHPGYGIPWTAFKEGAIGAFTGAKLAADTEIRVYFYATGREVIKVGNPEHTGVDWAVLGARRRACASGAVVQYHGDNFRLLFPKVRATMRHRL